MSWYWIGFVWCTPGMFRTEKLSFREHIHAKINKAYTMLGIIKCNFKFFVLIYNSMVRSHLD